eukprot:9493106-Pyramimonas_sp.AAC.1
MGGTPIVWAGISFANQLPLLAFVSVQECAAQQYALRILPPSRTSLGRICPPGSLGLGIM